MKNQFVHRWAAMLAMLVFSGTIAEAQSPIGNQKASATHNAPAAGAAQSPVVGGGTLGKLTKWTGFSTSNSVIGDTNIFEDKYGKVGIGTTTPTSLLTVQGMIETTLGGLKFPDGTVQSTAAVSGLQSIFHDLTLRGNGTSASPLGVALPLTLRGDSTELLDVRNTGGGDGIKTVGGNSSESPLVGSGISATGGDCFQFNCSGGAGVTGAGGTGPEGGAGILALGGTGSTEGGTGIVAEGGDPFRVAGSFLGSVEISDSLDVGGDLNVVGTKNFKIDHPLDPQNKCLLHAAIESSEVLNVYSGNVTTDNNGDAVVTFPDWFEAINRDFRYQLTVVGTFAQAIIAEKIKGNRFTIKSSTPNVEISWQVTGVRSDPVMIKHPFKAEQYKSERERGFYLSPDAYGQSEERGTEWARQPQVMRQLKERRELAKQKPASSR